MGEFYLTPLTATILVFVVVVAGYRYRRNWKVEGPRWKAWVFGLLAAGALLALGFVPLRFAS